MKRSPAITVAAAAALVAAVLPLVASVYTVRTVNGLLCFLVLTQCFNLLGGNSGYLNLGQGVFWGAGAYGFGLCMRAGCPAWAALCLVGIGAWTAGRLAAPLLFRLKGEAFALANLALLYLMHVGAVWLRAITGGADGFFLDTGARITAAYWSQLAAAVVIAAVALRLPDSRFGRQLRAMGQDPLAAVTLGVDTGRLKAELFALCAPFLAVSGALFMMAEGYIIPDTVFGLQMSLMPVAMAMVGGLGRPLGPVWGTVCIFGIQEWLWVYVGSLEQTLLGLMLIVAGKRKPIAGRLRVALSAWTAAFCRKAWY